MRSQPTGAFVCARNTLRVAAVLAVASCGLACAGNPAPAADVDGLGGGDLGGGDIDPVPAFSTPADPKAARAERFAAAAAAVNKRLKNKTVPELLKEAKRQESAANWNDARAAFQAVVLLHPSDPQAPAALEAATRMAQQLGETGEALAFFADATDAFTDPLVRARALRAEAQLLLDAPHWGTTRGGVFLRGRYEQGRQTETHRADRAAAIACLQEARAILTAAQASGAERAVTTIALADATAQFTPFDANWGYWWNAAEPEGELLAVEGEDEHADDDSRYSSWASALQNVEPRGLPLDTQGRVQFTPEPPSYEKATDDTGRIKALLREAEQLDDSPGKAVAAQALLQRAMYFRVRDGVERVQRLRSWWFRGARPYEHAGEEIALESLQDDDVITLAGKSLRKVTVPADESVPQVLKLLSTRYPQSAAAQEGAVLLGAYFQTRQQYARAEAVYTAVASAQPPSPFAGEAQSALTVLRAHEVELSAGSTVAAGLPLKLTLMSRNVDAVQVMLTRIDVDMVLKEFQRSYTSGTRTRDAGEVTPESVAWGLIYQRDAAVLRYLLSTQVSFEARVTRDPDHHATTSTLTGPVLAPGLWFAELRNRGEPAVLSRAVVAVEHSGLVVKRTSTGQVAWVVDARTGAPRANAAVSLFQYNSTYDDNGHERRSGVLRTVQTDGSGIAALPANSGSALLWVRTADGPQLPLQTWLGAGYSSSSGREDETVAVVVPDRSVYRPGDVVKLHIWGRERRHGVYQPAASIKKIMVRITDSRGAEVSNQTLPASRFGSVDVVQPIAVGAPLGAYQVTVYVNGSTADSGGEASSFRVEEYKAPEVLVEVNSAATARLGETVPIEIRASAYSGGPVPGAQVRYQIFRERYDGALVAEGPWDWLYGVGYGRIRVRAPWFSWWHPDFSSPDLWRPWWGKRPEPVRELVQQGEGKLDDAGVLRVSLSTAAALAEHGDSDHRYVVKAEVTDLSRHLVSGSGVITVTRHAFAAALEADSSAVQPGARLTFTLSAARADGTPHVVAGVVSLYALAGVDTDGRTVGERFVEEQRVTTLADGALSVRFAPQAPGQYRARFVAKDPSGQTKPGVSADVEASALVWVWGPGLDGTRYRFDGVEIIPDKRTYAVGDVAHLLVSADRAGASVLLATKVDSGALLQWRVLALPQKTTVVDVPITAGDVPNLFVEATAVIDAALYEEARELLVPPQDSALVIRAVPSAAEVKPGATATIDVTTTDDAGKPISAEVSVAVFDKATLAIQSDTVTDVRKHLWDRRRFHSVSSTSMLGRDLGHMGNVSSPADQAMWRLRWMAEGGARRAVAAAGAAITELAKDGERDDAAEDKSSLRLAGRGAGGGGVAPEKSMKRKAANKEEQANADTKASAAPVGGAKNDDAPAAADAVRKDFADTAAFVTVVTDAQGKASVPVRFPDNLTTWAVRAVGLDAAARGGRGDAALRTNKDLIVRLATPRFFRENDTVTFSLIAQNKRDDAQTVTLWIDLPKDRFTALGVTQRVVKVRGHAEARADFVAKVLPIGDANRVTARVRANARSLRDQDAKEVELPVLVQGMEQTFAAVGSIPMGEGTAERTLTVEVPAERRAAQTRLVVRTSPSLAGAMIDALPYLLDYPYGCVEQTLSRFVPAVVTRKALQQAGGISLQDLAGAHRNLNPQQLTPGGNVDPARLERAHKAYDRNPIYDPALLDDITRAGLRRVKAMQHGDGGWGWWADDDSSVYMTAQVMMALADARAADVDVDDGMFERGRAALSNLVDNEIWRYLQKDHDWVSDSDAYAALAMARLGDKHDKLLAQLFSRRSNLSTYGKLLLALTFQTLGDAKKAQLLLTNAEQKKRSDRENETTWIDTGTDGWWHWWNDDVETNAFYVRALDAIRPKNATSPEVVKWLLNHRKNGWYWDSTRDTAGVVGALAAHMQKSGERAVDYQLEIAWDGDVKKRVHVTSKNMFTVSADLELSGPDLEGGKHTVTVRRTGQGAVYFNSYLTTFSTGDDIKPTGLEIKVARRYFKLVPGQHTVDAEGARGQSVATTEAGFKKVAISTGAQLNSGDLVLVELDVTSKNDYEFLAFEDQKPAGLEAVAVRSGTVVGETPVHMELRDDRVTFFMSELTRGTITLRYRLRAEIPGTFSALPARGFAMYAPELTANSSSFRVGVADAP